MAVDSGLRLTSAANSLLKSVRKAARQGKATADGLWLAESPHLLEEAIASGCELACVLVGEEAEPAVRALAESSGAQLRWIPKALFAELATTQHSQGVLALVRPREWGLDAILERPGPVLVLDGVADPGNAGAIARSAEAFGAAGLILTRGCVHPGNPKVLRGSAGALFRLPFVFGAGPEAVVEACEDAQRPLLAALAHEGLSVRETRLARAAIVIGSEARGVGAAFSGASTAIHIPTRGVESLNAAMAAAIILYQAAGESLLGD